MKQLFTSILPKRAKDANQNLRSNLNGTITVKLIDPTETYTIDWRGNECTVKEGDSGTKDDKHVSIVLKQRHCQEIIDGDLNPQVAMLSGKIKAEGDLNLAIYLFNLLKGSQ